jgi:ribosomal protein S30
VQHLTVGFFRNRSSSSRFAASLLPPLNPAKSSPRTKTERKTISAVAKASSTFASPARKAV